MSKPWEETWAVEDDETLRTEIIETTTRQTVAHTFTSMRDAHDEAAARARIAACAPEMARCLLALLDAVDHGAVQIRTDVDEACAAARMVLRKAGVR